MKVLKDEFVLGPRNGRTTMDKKNGWILALIIFIGTGNLVLIFSVLGVQGLMSVAVATAFILFLALALYLLVRPWILN